MTKPQANPHTLRLRLIRRSSSGASFTFVQLLQSGRLFPRASLVPKLRRPQPRLLDIHVPRQNSGEIVSSSPVLPATVPPVRPVYPLENLHTTVWKPSQSFSYPTIRRVSRAFSRNTLVFFTPFFRGLGRSLPKPQHRQLKESIKIVYISIVPARPPSPRLVVRDRHYTLRLLLAMHAISGTNTLPRAHEVG